MYLINFSFNFTIADMKINSIFRSISPEIGFEHPIFNVHHSSRNNLLGYELNSAENYEKIFGEGANEDSGFNPLSLSVLHHSDPNSSSSDSDATKEENNVKGDSTFSFSAMQS